MQLWHLPIFLISTFTWTSGVDWHTWLKPRKVPGCIFNPSLTIRVEDSWVQIEFSLYVLHLPDTIQSAHECICGLMSAGTVFCRIDGKWNLFPSFLHPPGMSLESYGLQLFGIPLNVWLACASLLLGTKKKLRGWVYLPNVVKEKPRLTPGNCMCT